MLKKKIVKIADPSLLSFFYPDYIVKAEINFMDRDNKIIYTGRSRASLKQFLDDNTKSWISTTGIPEIDLNDKATFLNFIFSSQGREPSKQVVEQSQVLDDDEFMFCCKTFWVCGRWPYQVKDEEDKISVYDLFKGTIGPMKELLVIYFKLCEKYPLYVVESSLITFLLRASNISEQDVNPGYMRLLKGFYAKSGTAIKPAIMKYAKKDNIDPKLRLLDLILSLR